MLEVDKNFLRMRIMSKSSLDIKESLFVGETLTKMSSNSRLIGLAGRKGVGKDVIADVLCQCGYTKRALALPLKTACRHLFMFSDNQLWGDDKDVIDERYGKSPRELMQIFGTDFLRNMISKTFWIDRFKEWYNTQNGNIVVSDVRFLNEVEMIQQLGGKVILVKRDGLDSDETHESEQAEDLERRIDCTVYNDGSLEALIAKARLLLERV